MEEITFSFNAEKSTSMAQYMRNQFAFCGLPTKERREQIKPFLKASVQLETDALVALIFFYYQKKEREYQYVAIDLARKNVKRLSQKELEKISQLVLQKSWWDTVDSLASVISEWLLSNPTAFSDVFRWFYQHENIWMRRVSLIIQLKLKEGTHTQELAEAILYDQTTNEFFIQKAIGWALREYSKTNPQWVAAFFATHELSSLAVREGSKYL